MLCRPRDGQPGPFISPALQPEVKTSISLFMSYVHTTVNEMSKIYLATERRYNYTTPKTFLEQIKLYQNLLSKKRMELVAKIERLENGLMKLQSTASQVGAPGPGCCHRTFSLGAGLPWGTVTPRTQLSRVKRSDDISTKTGTREGVAPVSREACFSSARQPRKMQPLLYAVHAGCSSRWAPASGLRTNLPFMLITLIIKVSAWL